jgi:hypothetical protein
MRRSFDAVPHLSVGSSLHAGIDVLLGGTAAGKVVETTVDAVPIDLIARTKVVHIACKWTIGDAALGAGTVTPEAELSIKDFRCGEVASVNRLLPVSMAQLVIESDAFEEQLNFSRLAASVATDSLKLVLMRPHEVTVERQEGTDEVSHLRDVDMDALQLIKDRLGASHVELCRCVHKTHLSIEVRLLLLIGHLMPILVPGQSGCSYEQVFIRKGSASPCLALLGVGAFLALKKSAMGSRKHRGCSECEEESARCHPVEKYCRLLVTLRG